MTIPTRRCLRGTALALAALLQASAAGAQQEEIVEIPLDEPTLAEPGTSPGASADELRPERPEAETGTGAVLRGLDKITTETRDVTIGNGQSARLWRLDVRLDECRHPVGDPAGDAWAHLVIREEGSEAPVFSGWMIASAPALNTLEHPRYDVWVIRCTSS